MVALSCTVSLGPPLSDTLPEYVDGAELALDPFQRGLQPGTISQVDSELLSIQKAPASFLRRYVSTLRQQPLLRLFRVQCHGKFRHCRQYDVHPASEVKQREIFHEAFSQVSSRLIFITVSSARPDLALGD